MTPVSVPLPGFFGDFAAGFGRLFPEALTSSVLARHQRRGAGLPKLSALQWLMALVYHALAGSGTFATHVLHITGVALSDSALSQRRHSLGWQLLADLLPAVLRPLAVPAEHPDAFHKGLRLLAVDGSRFHLRNTAALNAAARKVKCSRGGGLPAFAHLLCVVLVEIGTHLPLAASLGWQGEGEITLVRHLFASLSPRSLLLADRLYGSPWLLWELAPRLAQDESHFLMRVKSNLKVRRRTRLDDGSWLVAVPVVDPATRRRHGHLLLREIIAEIRVDKDQAPLRMRLWTSLCDATEHPALELVELYAQRWEEELFFRELKSHVHGARQLLHAQTATSAAQEVLAMLLGAALVAEQRAAVGQAAGVPVRRISLAQVLEQTVALCHLLELGRGVLDRRQEQVLVERLLQRLAATAVIPVRRPRSCQRAMRQPVKDWPKMKHPTSRSLVKLISIPAKP